MIKPKKTIIDALGYEPPLYSDSWILKLDFNENILGPSPKVIEAIKGLSEDDIKFYPAPGELIEKLAEINNVDKSMILPTNGADEAISYIFDTFIEDKDTVLTIAPTFSMPKVYATSVGCNYKQIKYLEKWVFPVDEVIKNIDENTRMVIVTTPNSPTGDAISRENLLRIIEAASNSIILIDETYSGFTEERFSDLVNKYSNVIVIRSFSKDYALAGLRLGYIIANTQVIDYIRRIFSPFSVNAVAVKAGIAAIEDKEYFESVKGKVIESKKILTDGLKDLAKSVYPSEGNFLLVDFGEKADFIYKKLLNSGIKVKYFSGDPEIKTCFRITMPAPDQARIFLEALKPRDLVIFDIDGVLVDVRNSYRMAIKGTYEYFAKQPLELDKIQQAKNSGGLNNDWDLTEYLLRQSGFSIPKESIIEKFQELYFGNNGDGFILNEELLVDTEYLKDLAKKYDLAVFTGRPKQEADFVLKRWNLDKLFSIVITMDDIPADKQKPDPFGVNKIINIISPSKTYYLGDTPDDMIAAKKAGVNGIGILPPQDKSPELRQRLLDEGAVEVFSEAGDFKLPVLSITSTLL